MRKDSFCTLLMAISTVVLTTKSEPIGEYWGAARNIVGIREKQFPKKNRWACLYCYQLEPSAMVILEEQQ